MARELDRLIYVEDDPDIRSLVALVLGDLGGFTIDVCGSGQEALEKTPRFGPDLIILDVMMPGMDGIETSKRLREIPALSNTPFIFMTAKASEREREHYRELGAADTVQKPFDPLTLAERIRGIWERIHLAAA